MHRHDATKRTCEATETLGLPMFKLVNRQDKARETPKLYMHQHEATKRM